MRTRLAIAVGLFLFVSAAYIAAGPGRIDIIDGQYRFEVARNVVEDGSTQVRDPALGYAVRGLLGFYSPYGLSGSLTGVPLVAAASIFGTHSRERQQFFFSFTSAIFGAASIAVLYVFMVSLGIASRRALAWSLVAALATLAWPVATSTFDQTQHGFFILCACLFAYLSARRDSLPWAAAAGGCLAFLINFQETYAILLPTIAVAALAPAGASAPERKRGFERGALLVFIGASGVLIWMGINSFRYGSLFHTVLMNPNHPPALGNPLIGIPGLLVSPGKSIFLYSPPTAIAIVGVIRLVRTEPRLGQAIAATSLAYFALVSSLTFYGGDWCWGPRYFASILPILALGFPFVPAVSRLARTAVAALIVAGLFVQVLALSVDHHRFFYGHSLPTFFWYSRPAYYFTHSALFSRPSEIVASLREGVPAEAEAFRPGPYPALLTYAVFGGWGHLELAPPLWMRHYAVFWLPRPWPLWLRYVPPHDRPVNLKDAAGVLTLLAATGLALLWTGSRKQQNYDAA